MEIEQATILLRIDTAVNWAANNPALGKGEVGVETQAAGPAKIKIGDGAAAWNALPYVFNAEALEEAIAALQLSLEEAISGEIAAREGADADILQAIADEKQERSDAVADILREIGSEIAAREGADANILQAIADERQERSGADALLEGAIGAETAARGSADAILQQNINAAGSLIAAETSERETEAGKLLQKINIVSGKLDDEEFDRKAADTAEAAARSGADTALQGAIATAIAGEVGDRDGAIATAIAGEVSDRDGAIAAAIAGEVSDRDGAIAAAIAGEVSDRDGAIEAAIAAEVTARNGAIAAADGKLWKGANNQAGILIDLGSDTLNSQEIIFNILYNETSAGNLIRQAAIHGQAYGGFGNRVGMVQNGNAPVAVFYFQGMTEAIGSSHSFLWIPSSDAAYLPSARAEAWLGDTDGAMTKLPVVVSTLADPPEEPLVPIELHSGSPGAVTTGKIYIPNDSYPVSAGVSIKIGNRISRFYFGSVTLRSITDGKTAKFDFVVFANSDEANPWLYRKIVKIYNDYRATPVSVYKNAQGEFLLYIECPIAIGKHFSVDASVTQTDIGTNGNVAADYRMPEYQWEPAEPSGLYPVGTVAL
jgi:hypothetical protein